MPLRIVQLVAVTDSCSVAATASGAAIPRLPSAAQLDLFDCPVDSVYNYLESVYIKCLCNHHDFNLPQPRTGQVTWVQMHAYCMKQKKKCLWPFSSTEQLQLQNSYFCVVFVDLYCK